MRLHDIRFALAAPTWAALPDDGRPEFAFVGRSNVGKSSLLNALVGRKNLAHTSGTPGKTQALNFYLAEEQAPHGGFYLVDLPGYGFAKVSKQQRAAWQRLIGRYVTERAPDPLRIIFHLIDSRHEPTRLDEELMAVLKESPAPRVILLTKGDKLSRNQQQQAEARVKRFMANRGLELPVVLTSAAKRDGMDRVWHWIETLA